MIQNIALEQCKLNIWILETRRTNIIFVGQCFGTKIGYKTTKPETRNTLCCMQGEIQLLPMKIPSKDRSRRFDAWNDQKKKQTCQKNIKSYNIFCFTSMGEEDRNEH